MVYVRGIAYKQKDNNKKQQKDCEQERKKAEAQ